VNKVWGRFWLLESLELFDADASWVFAITLFAMFQDFDKLFQCLATVRAGLSTWWNSCGDLVSVGAGLPTQRNDWGLRF